MLRIAICDDDIEIQKRFYDFLKDDHLVDKIEFFTDGESFLKKHEHYDLLFLDIDMAGINGIETGREIRKWDKQVYIVYVTHLSDYRQYAMGVHAFGYLEKPVSKEDIEAVLSEVMAYKQAVDQPVYLEFMTEEGIKRLDVEDIYYFEYSNRKIVLHTREGVFGIRQKMGALAEQMIPYHFCQPHKSFCVNLYHVRSIKGYDILLTKGERIPLSQKKSVAFREQLNIYLEHLII